MNPFDQLQPIDARPSASERVAERLMSLIASGNIAPGDKLPSESELVKALHVSRPIVREALRGLAMMGIVESRQGGASYITDLKPNRLMAPLSFVLSLADYSMDSLFKARVVIDTGLAAAAALNADDEQIRLLSEFVDAGFKLVDDPVAFRVMDSEFHALIGIAAQNEFLDRVSLSLYGMAIEARRKASTQPGVLERSAADHDHIVKAIVARDPVAAAAAMTAHVESIRASTVAVLQSEGAGRP
jgi:GntR family transcriptional repressor for pyruvate dehydrogenase complex